MRLAGLIAFMVWAAGCIPGPPPPVYAVQRSALVAHPSPPVWSGTPLRGRVQFQASSSTVVIPVTPEETQGANAGLFVARTNIGGTLRMRFGDTLTVKLIGEFSPDTKAMQISEESLGAPKGMVATLGAGLEYSIPLSGPWRLGLAGDLSLGRSPFREQGRCIENCFNAADYYEEGRHSVPIYSASVIPSYTFGDVVVFGGLTMRNHPTNTRKNRQIAGADDEDDELRQGPAYYLLGTGVEVRAGRHLSFVGHVFQPISTDIAKYGPAVGFAIRGELYDPKPKRYSRAQLSKSLAR
tara:strand:- start:15776 stop:16663 length:888 start_codon:yes stop_codon:yes gene_type:complete